MCIGYEIWISNWNWKLDADELGSFPWKWQLKALKTERKLAYDEEIWTEWKRMIQAYLSFYSDNFRQLQVYGLADMTPIEVSRVRICLKWKRTGHRGDECNTTESEISEFSRLFRHVIQLNMLPPPLSKMSLSKLPSQLVMKMKCLYCRMLSSGFYNNINVILMASSNSPYGFVRFKRVHCWMHFPLISLSTLFFPLFPSHSPFQLSLL